VFSVIDGAIEFPDSHQQGAGARTEHGSRRCIVVQTAIWGNSTRPTTVLVVPCSASQRGPAAPWDFQIPSGADAFDRDHVIAFTSLVQPVLKSDLLAHHGDLDPRTLLDFRLRLAQVLDLREIPDEAIGDE
jgi:mRNA-degrading endonuclease toxin of MazEF toxin-antitoxin module